MWMRKEYLSTLKSLKAKGKARPLSAMNLKTINIKLLCTLFSMESALKALKKGTPVFRHTFEGLIITKVIRTQIINPPKVYRTVGRRFQKI